MTTHDPDTLAFYAAEAEAYAARRWAAPQPRLGRFLAALPAGAAILELGCGGGQDSAVMLARGFEVTPTDGSPEMAREAERRLGQPVAVLLFQDLEGDLLYDGVWARACLLHLPRPELPGVIGRVHRILKPGGRFYASFKAGAGEGRDRLGRYFNYPSAEELRGAFAAAPWNALEIEAAEGDGYDGEPTPWLHVTAVKPR